MTVDDFEQLVREYCSTIDDGLPLELLSLPIDDSCSRLGRCLEEGKPYPELYPLNLPDGFQGCVD